MQRKLFDQEHEMYRESVRTFLEKEVVSDYLAWTSMWTRCPRRAGAQLDGDGSQ